MERNKKQAVLAVLMIALLLLGAVGGTLAYLKTQTSEIKNEFQPAGVPSEVMEKLENDVKTNVRIKNNGNVKAYVRAAIVVTWKDAEGDIYPGTPVVGDDYTISINTDEWTEKGGYYYYKGIVDPDGGESDVLIDSCSPVDNRAPSGYFLNVEILGQAIQAEGMGATGAVDAWQKALQGN